MIGTLAIILVLGALIFIHELGHFLVARSMGIGVKTFSLGFGPKLYSRQSGKTTYQVAALPLGGFVALVGESPDADIPEPFTREESFSLRPSWQRLLVVLAGPVFNLVLAWLICWGIIFSNGINEIPPVIGTVSQETPAAEYLLPEDRIISLNGDPISRWEQIPIFLRGNEDREVTVIASQPGQEARTMLVRPVRIQNTSPKGEVFESWGFGITPKEILHHELGFIDSGIAAVNKSAEMATLIWKSIGWLVSGKESPKNLGGPVYIAQKIYEEADQGLTNVLVIAAIISVNLGILNLLPIPVLDGGHIFFLLIETIRRRPISPAIQEKAMIGGLVLLLALMVFATSNDILRLLGFHSPG